MDRAAVCEIVERVSSLDASGADRRVLAAALGDVALLRNWLDGREAAFASALARVSSYPERGLALAERIALRQGERVVARAGIVDRVPALGAALVDGRISGAHVDAFGRTLRALEPPEQERLLEETDRLIALATCLSADSFARELRRVVARLRTRDGMDQLEEQRRASSARAWVDPNTGMWHLAAEFDPLTGALIAKHLQSAVDALFHDRVPETAPSDPVARQDHLRALALAHLTGAMVQEQGRESEPVPTPTGRGEIVAVLDLTNPGPDGTPTIDFGLPIEVPARVLAGLAGTLDSSIVIVRNGVVLYAPGQLNLGRTTRVASRAQRRALRAWYSTCAVPGCHAHYDRCKLHHVVWWRHGGNTDLDNLLPLCSRHHHKVHDGGWELTLALDRSLTIRFPDGTVQTTGPPRRRAA